MAVRGGWGDGTLTEILPGKWKYRLPPYVGRRQHTFLAANKTAAKKEARRILEDAYNKKANPHHGNTPTFDQLCEHTLGQYRDRQTLNKMRSHLKSARETFGHVPADQVDTDTFIKWERTVRARVSEQSAHSYSKSVRAVFNDAVRRGVLAKSPAALVKNPEPKAGVVNPFERIEEVEAVAAELPAVWRALPIFVCTTGLRVEEWAALERADIRDGSIFVNKRWTAGTFKAGTKNGDPERIVPLHPLAAAALKAHPTRLDTKLLFPRPEGGYLNMTYWARDIWTPAFKAAGIEYRRPKEMRHTFATWSLSGNCNTWTLSKVMGTSVQNIERTYGRWIPGSERVLFAAMDLFVERSVAK